MWLTSKDWARGQSLKKRGGRPAVAYCNNLTDSTHDADAFSWTIVYRCPGESPARFERIFFARRVLPAAHQAVSTKELAADGA